MLILKNTVTPKTVEVLLPILDCFSNNKESLEICVSEVLSRVTEMTGTNDMISILESVNAETFEITTVVKKLQNKKKNNFKQIWFF